MESNVKTFTKGINPSSTLPYFDRFTIWLKQPLSDPEYRYLRQHCGGRVDKKRQGERFKDKSGEWKAVLYPNSAYRERIQLCQPDDHALQWAADRKDAQLTYVEFAVDWVFDNDEPRRALYQLLDRCLIKRHHRAEYEIVYVERTRYTDRRGAPSNIVMYDDLECRVTGELECLHVELRSVGSPALRRIGISSTRDLVNFDHRKFWSDRLVLCAVDLRRLGRLNSNRYHQSRRRRGWVTRRRGYSYDNDLHIGAVLARNVGGTAQAVLDNYRNDLAVRRCLIPIDVTHLLPPSRPCDYADKLSVVDLTPLSPTHFSNSKVKLKSEEQGETEIAQEIANMIVEDDEKMIEYFDEKDRYYPTRPTKKKKNKRENATKHRRRVEKPKKPTGGFFNFKKE